MAQEKKVSGCSYVSFLGPSLGAAAAARDLQMHTSIGLAEGTAGRNAAECGNGVHCETCRVLALGQQQHMNGRRGVWCVQGSADAVSFRESKGTSYGEVSFGLACDLACDIRLCIGKAVFVPCS